MFFDFEILNSNSLQQKDKDFFDNIYNSDKAEVARIELKNYFDSHVYDKEKFKYSYWRWYVILTWSNLLNLSFSDLLIVVKEQIFDAFSLGFDVQRLIFSYLRNNYLNLGDLQDAYAMIRLTAKGVVSSNLLDSTMNVGDLAGEAGQLIEEKSEKKKNEFEKKIKEIVFKIDEEFLEKYYEQNFEKIVKKFIMFLGILNSVNDDEIGVIIEEFFKNPADFSDEQCWKNIFEIKSVRGAMEKITKDYDVDEGVLGGYIENLKNKISRLPVDKNINGIKIEELFEEINKYNKTPSIDEKIKIVDKIKKTILSNNENADISTIKLQKKDDSMKFFKKNNNEKKQLDKTNIEANTVAAPQALIKPSSVLKKNEKPVEAPKKLSYLEIKKRIENSFAKDKDGNFVNLSEVLAELQRISSQQGDPKVKDLYIFNEQKGIFEWNNTIFEG